MLRQSHPAPHLLPVLPGHVTAEDHIVFSRCQFGSGRRKHVGGPLVWNAAVLDVVVQGELMRVRPQRDLFQLLVDLVVDVGLDQILGKNFALHQKVVVVL